MSALLTAEFVLGTWGTFACVCACIFHAPAPWSRLQARLEAYDAMLTLANS